VLRAERVFPTDHDARGDHLGQRGAAVLASVRSAPVAMDIVGEQCDACCPFGSPDTLSEQPHLVRSNRLLGCLERTPTSAAGDGACTLLQ
jgi:hypothetical protein